MTNYKESGRKFNDIWALILYIVYSLTLLAALCFYSQTSNYFVLLQKFDFKIILVTFFFIILQFFSLLAGFILFPAPIMHFSCVGMPIISFIFALLYRDALSIAVTGIFSLIALGFYFFIFKHQIKYAAVICQRAASIIKKNSFITFSYLVGSSLLSGIVVYIITSALRYFPKEFIFTATIFGIALLFYWTLFNVLYSLRVFVSSYVLLHYIEHGQNADIGSQSLMNLFYALGSICFGGLLVAIVSALQLLVDREAQNRRNNGGSAIFALLIGIILNILRDLIDYSNQWTFCYISLTGKDYINSTKESWTCIFRTYGMMINSYLSESIIAIISVLFTIMFGFVSFQILSSSFSQTPNKFSDPDLLYSYLFLFFTYSFVSVSIYCVFESAVKALLFTNTLLPAQIRNKDEKLSETFNAQRKNARS